VLPQPLRPWLADVKLRADRARAGSSGRSVRAWPAAEANAIIAAALGERILSKPRRPISATNFSLLAWEDRTAEQMWGDRERKPGTIPG
jgi:hypothetical protein